MLIAIQKVVLIALLLVTFSTLPAAEAKPVAKIPSEAQMKQEILPREMDERAIILAAYFARFDSPLQYQAQDFIDAADFYKVNWKLVPSISGVESTFGKHIPGGYNAYGWAIFNSDSRFGFKSWRDGIFIVTGGLKKNYIDKGLTDPYSMNRVYATSNAWGGKVDFFMKDLERFEKEYKQLASK